MPGNRAVRQPQTTQRKPDNLMHQFFAVHLVIDHRLLWQMIDRNHGGEVMRETHAVFPADWAFDGVTSRLSRSQTGLDLVEAAREPALIQHTGELTVLEATVQNHPMLGLPRNRVAGLAHHDRAKEIINDMHKCGRGWVKVGQLLQTAVFVLTAGILYLRIERFLAWKMFIDKRFGNARGV